MSDLNKACEEEKQKKHINIMNGIANLDSAVTRLENLHGDIIGQQPIPKECAKASTEVSLIEFMDTTPNMLEEIVDRIYSVQDAIRQAIL